MALRKIYIRDENFKFRILNAAAGFALMELLISLVLFAIIFSMGLFFSMDSYRGYTFRSERNIAIALLQKARAQALANIHQQPHGIHVDTIHKKYVVFEGSVFSDASPSNVDVPFISAAVTHSGMNDVVFDQLTGGISTVPLPWHFANNLQVSDILFNNEGQITWTN